MGADGREYPVPTLEQVQGLFAGNAELVRKKTAQGFDQLAMTPMAMPLMHLFDLLPRCDFETRRGRKHIPNQAFGIRAASPGAGAQREAGVGVGHPETGDRDRRVGIFPNGVHGQPWRAEKIRGHPRQAHVWYARLVGGTGGKLPGDTGAGTRQSGGGQKTTGDRSFSQRIPAGVAIGGVPGGNGFDTGGFYDAVPHPPRNQR